MLLLWLLLLLLLLFVVVVVDVVVVVVVVVVATRLLLFFIAPLVPELTVKSTGQYALSLYSSSRPWGKRADSVRGFPEAACLQTYGCYGCC